MAALKVLRKFVTCVHEWHEIESNDIYRHTKTLRTLEEIPSKTECLYHFLPLAT